MIEFSLSKYKKSISDLRVSLGVGVPENRVEGVSDIHCGGTHYRFNIEDLYMTHMKLATDSDWSEIKRHNYSQMGITTGFSIGGGKFRSAMADSLPSGTNLALVIIATAEAARSQVVYCMVQSMLQKSNLKVTWGELNPILIGSWIHNTKENNKCRPIKYGALGAMDYYNQEAKDVIATLKSKGIDVG